MSNKKDSKSGMQKVSKMRITCERKGQRMKDRIGFVGSWIRTSSHSTKTSHQLHKQPKYLLTHVAVRHTDLMMKHMANQCFGVIKS